MYGELKSDEFIKPEYKKSRVRTVVFLLQIFVFIITDNERTKGDTLIRVSVC
jgi:hypothetical protein